MITFQWGLNRYSGTASVVFPVEIWLLILEILELRDLYSLTVTSKFFYNNLISIYLNRVAREGIPRRERPTPARSRMPCSWMLPLSFPDYTGTDFLNTRDLYSSLRHYAHWSHTHRNVNSKVARLIPHGRLYLYHYRVLLYPRGGPRFLFALASLSIVGCYLS